MWMAMSPPELIPLNCGMSWVELQDVGRLREWMMKVYQIVVVAGQVTCLLVFDAWLQVEGKKGLAVQFSNFSLAVL